jgi:hypothetical protein
MTTSAQIERLVGKALMVPAFRTALLADPVKAARSLRILLDADTAEIIRRIDRDELNKVAQQLRATVPSPGQFTLW